jgi:glycosyltransferase involved in cell wall biosynthesis
VGGGDRIAPQMMNILHVYKTFLNDSFGGVEQVISQIAMASTPSDFKHTVVSLSKIPAMETDQAFGVRNIRYPETVSIASNAMSYALLRDFGRLAKSYDLIHYHFPWPFADLMHGSWRIKTPSILTYHSDIVRQKQMLRFYRPLMHYFLNSVDHVVATSPNYLATSEVLQQYQDKVTVIPIGLTKNNDLTPTEIRKNYWRDRFGDRFFLFVGVMRYYKGLHILLEAMRHTSYPVVLVGTGPIEAELKKQALALNITNVHFVGQLSDLDKTALLQLCTSVVFPSHLRSEAFGVSLLEGAMFGKALISSEIGTGTSYINQDGKTGLVVPPNDPQAFRQAMDFIWNNPERAEVMGQCAQARYEELFTGAQMAAEYEKLYLNVLNSI